MAAACGKSGRSTFRTAPTLGVEEENSTTRRVTLSRGGVATAKEMITSKFN